MQCRICFEDGDAITLVTPCQCRGTSAYIHQACLDRYIQYYPDRTCRVCRNQFPVTETPSEIGLCWILFTCLVVALFVSQVAIPVKVFLFGIGFFVCAYLLHRRLLNSTPISFIAILAFLILPGGHSMAMTICFLVIGTLAIVYTLARLIPAVLLLSIVVTLMFAGYAVFLTMFAYHALDSPAFTVYLSILYLLWYAWVHDLPRLQRV